MKATQPPGNRQFTRHQLSPSQVAEAVSEAWESALGIGASDTDDFFESGGNSLTAIRLVGKVRQTLGVDVGVEVVFKHPSLGNLVAHISSLVDKVPRSITPEPAANEEAGYPLMPTQERLWFLSKMSPESLAYNYQSVLRFSGAIDVPTLVKALDEIIRRHEILRTTFGSTNGQPSQLVHPPLPAAIEIVDVRDREDSESEASRIVSEAVSQPFDVERLPLIRWTLIRLADDNAWLAHVESHLVHDGWSFGVFVGELMTLYRDYLDGDKSSLPPVRIQFREYAAIERGKYDRDLRSRVEHWSKLLDQVPQTGLSRPAESSGDLRGEFARVAYPGELSSRVRALARRLKLTPFIVSFAAFAVWMRYFTDQDDFAVGTSYANRLTSTAESLIGCFLGNVAIPVHPGLGSTFAEFAGGVGEALAQSFRYPDTPFHLVASELGLPRSIESNLFFQASFDFHNAPFPDLEIPGVSVEIEEGLHNGYVKFPIDVLVVPRSQNRVFPRRQDTDTMELRWRVGGIALAATGHARQQALEFLRILETVTLDENARISSFEPLATPLGQHGSPYASSQRDAVSGTHHPDAGILGMVAEVLELEHVPSSANFFELGGHSLLAVSLVAKIREALGIDLPVRTVFEVETVGELARRVATEYPKP